MWDPKYVPAHPAMDIPVHCALYLKYYSTVGTCKRIAKHGTLHPKFMFVMDVH
jgi:hypothetical protein